MEIREVEFWHLPLKWLVTLTTVLRYRAACDARRFSMLAKRRSHFWMMSIYS